MMELLISSKTGEIFKEQKPVYDIAYMFRGSKDSLRGQRYEEV